MSDMIQLPNMRQKRRELSRQLGRPVPLAEIAKSIGYTRAHLSHVENGAGCSGDFADLLAHYLGCSVAELARESEEKPKKNQDPEKSRPTKRGKSDTKGPSRVKDQAVA